MSQKTVTKPRVLLLLPTRTYRATDFLDAALNLDVEVVVASEEPATTKDLSPRDTLVLNFRDSIIGTQSIQEYAENHPIAAIIGVDDDTTMLATTASATLGLTHNSISSALATRNKYLLRQTLEDKGVSVPNYRRFLIDDDTEKNSRQIDYPCILKPLSLSASRGVIRADNPKEFVDAFQRITALLNKVQETRGTDADDDPYQYILVEDYIPGIEIALEGILISGELKTLALFDKPDPLEGPFFEETLYITPSRLPDNVQEEIHKASAEAATALGLRHGPIHAELRYNEKGAHLIEIAARTIGGLCSRTLKFGTGISLEELVIRHAIGDSVDSFSRENQAAGVMMIPVPKAGILGEVRGKKEARKVENIEEVNITISVGTEIIPLPEGDKYLGFIFARGETPEVVEESLRKAHQHLEFVII